MAKGPALAVKEPEQANQIILMSLNTKFAAVNPEYINLGKEVYNTEYKGTKKETGTDETRFVYGYAFLCNVFAMPIAKLNEISSAKNAPIEAWSEHENLMLYIEAASEEYARTNKMTVSQIIDIIEKSNFADVSAMAEPAAKLYRQATVGGFEIHNTRGAAILPENITRTLSNKGVAISPFAKADTDEFCRWYWLILAAGASTETLPRTTDEIDIALKFMLLGATTKMKDDMSRKIAELNEQKENRPWIQKAWGSVKSLFSTPEYQKTLEEYNKTSGEINKLEDAIKNIGMTRETYANIKKLNDQYNFGINIDGEVERYLRKKHADAERLVRREVEKNVGLNSFLSKESRALLSQFVMGSDDRIIGYCRLYSRIEKEHAPDVFASVFGGEEAAASPEMAAPEQAGDMAKVRHLLKFLSMIDESKLKEAEKNAYHKLTDAAVNGFVESLPEDMRMKIQPLFGPTAGSGAGGEITAGEIAREEIITGEITSGEINRGQIPALLAETLLLEKRAILPDHFTREELNDYVWSKFELNSRQFIAGIFIEALSDKSAKGLRLLDGFFQVAGMYTHLISAKRMPEIAEAPVFIPTEEAVRAFWASVMGLLFVIPGEDVYLKNNKDIITPGVYNSGKYDCYDWASTITRLAHLGISPTNTSELQNAYWFLSQYYRKKTDMEIFKPLLVNSIKSLSREDPQSHVLMYMLCTIEANPKFTGAAGFFDGAGMPRKIKTANLADAENIVTAVNEKYSLGLGDDEIAAYSTKLFEDNSQMHTFISALFSPDAGAQKIVSKDSKALIREYAGTAGAGVAAAMPAAGIQLPSNIAGSWLDLHGRSPYNFGSDHHGILGMNDKGEITLYDFIGKSGKTGYISAIEWNDLADREKKMYKGKWHTKVYIRPSAGTADNYLYLQMNELYSRASAGFGR